MSSRVFLHVGSPKTGTTFLQQVLWSQRDLAKEQGLLLPLDAFFDHYLATLEVREVPPQPVDAQRASGVWSRIVEASRAWEGDVLVSHELFAGATEQQAERAIAAFGPDVEVHVVLTARDLVRQVPAEWQEHVKHRSAARFDDFVADLMREDPKTWFWRVQHFGEVLRRWGGSLPAEQVHVVTVPPPGQPMNLLWDRFAGLVGLDPSAFDSQGSRANTSLGYEQAEVLRRVNESLGERLPLPGPYAPVVKSLFAESVLSRQAGTRLALSGEALEYARAKSERLADEIAGLGVDVVGDLADLVPATEAGPGGDVVPPGDAVLLSESVDALAGLLDEYARLRRDLPRLRALEREMKERPVKHFLRGASERWSWAGRAPTLAARARARVRDARGAR